MRLLPDNLNDMKTDQREREMPNMKQGQTSRFTIIGENVHTTRIVLRRGRMVTTSPDGLESMRFLEADGRARYLTIPEEVKRTQDYDEGRVKHVKIAIQAAMAGKEPEATDGMDYLRRLVERQIAARADFLDLNVDEISLKPNEQKEAMKWLVETVQSITDTPLSVDSSNVEVIEAGLQRCCRRRRRHLLNSASLERVEALDLAVKYDTCTIVTAAGESSMPQGTEERVDNASRMVDAALERGLSLKNLYVDPLVFPISVDSEFGNHCFEAIRRLRRRFGPHIHITGGFSNVSFGLPARRLINDTFLNLAVEAGADSGIIDPVTTRVDRALSMDRSSGPCQLAEDLLLGRDLYCANFLRAYRKGELDG